MNKNILVAAVICSSVAVISTSTSAQAQLGKNTIGPSVLFGSGNSAVGIDSKFGIADNISIRPSVYFPNGGTIFGAGLTYDFDLKGGNANKITPFAGGLLFISSANNGGASRTDVGITGGADFDVSESIQLKGAITVPISSNNSSTLFGISAGFRF